MYGWIFRTLPGPIWLRTVLFLLLIAAAVAALFHWVFPWLSDFINLNAPTIGALSPVSVQGQPETDFPLTWASR